MFLIVVGDEYLLKIGQKLECLHLPFPAYLHEVCYKTDSEEVRYQLTLIAFYRPSRCAKQHSTGNETEIISKAKT